MHKQQFIKLLKIIFNAYFFYCGPFYHQTFKTTVYSLNHIQKCPEHNNSNNESPIHWTPQWMFNTMIAVLIEQ